MIRCSLFFDRDGVLNVDHANVYKLESFEFIDGIFELVRKAREFDYLLLVVTNKAGIGSGYFSEDEFRVLTEWMKAQFAARGSAIDAVNFYPDHPQLGLGQYCMNSPMRKPGPGMQLQARDEFDIDMALSVMGDNKSTDMQAEFAAGFGNLLWMNSKEDEGLGEPVFPLKEASSRLRPA